MITCTFVELLCATEGTRPILPYLSPVTFLGGLIEKLGRPPEDVRAENLRRWASSVSGATPIAKLAAKERYRIAGVIQNIRIDPREGHGSIEATIIDGSGQMIVKWFGKPTKSGIRLGVGLIVEGVVGRSPDGELQVLNPEYELVMGPEHG
jgi:hypothetical protein